MTGTSDSAAVPNPSTKPGVVPEKMPSSSLPAPKINPMEIQPSKLSFGGTRKKKALALLDGVYQDPVNGEQERVTIDLSRLPAILGRSNEGDKGNPHFFGLGKKKALSRKHCMIYYVDAEGGRVEWDEMADKLVYKDPTTVAKQDSNKKPPRPNPLASNDKEFKTSNGYPPHGFFAIECIGKNRIMVDQTRVDQGESVVLQSGSAVRISSYMLYFMIPRDAKPKAQSIEIPLSKEEKEKLAAKTKKKKATPTKARSGSSGSKDEAKKTSSPTKKRPAVPTLAAAAMKKPKSSGTNSFTAALAELEILPVEELIERMNNAVTKGIWDRRNQFIGATICYHAVRSAGHAIEIQEKAAEDGGVSRSGIMEWIEQSDQYGDWVQQMLTNMEPRSYQASITKSLLKAGFTRTSGAGRYIKWKIPKDIPMKVQMKTSSTSSKADMAAGKKDKSKTNETPSDDGDSDDGADDKSSANGEEEDEGEDENEKGDGDEEEDDDEDEENDNDAGSAGSEKAGDEEEAESDADEEENEEDNNDNDSGNDDEADNEQGMSVENGDNDPGNDDE